MSVGEVSIEELSLSVSLGSVHEEVSVGEPSAYQFMSETFSEELI